MFRLNRRLQSNGNKMNSFQRDVNCFRIFCVTLILAGCCPRNFGDVFAQSHSDIGPAIGTTIDNTQNQFGQPSNNKDLLSSFWNDAWKLPGIIAEETQEIVKDKDYLIPLLLAGGASIVMNSTAADGRIASNFEDQGLNEEVDKIIDYLGNPGIHFAASGLWYAMSHESANNLSKQRAWTMLKALSVTSATTLGLKLLRHNRTPNGKALAWPSGHTSSSFTVAAVLDEFYGPEVGFPAYLGAGFVGYRMIDSGDHWASDVVFGAVLGYIVGHHIAGKDIKLELAGFEVVPYSDTIHDETVMGVNLVKNF